MTPVNSLTLANATVRPTDGTAINRVSVHVREGQAVVKQGQRAAAPLLQRDGVAAIERLNRRTYTITFEDGSAWEVTRTGCNCGSR